MITGVPPLVAAVRWAVTAISRSITALEPSAVIFADLFAVVVSKPPFLFLTIRSFLLTRPSAASTLLTARSSALQAAVS